MSTILNLTNYVSSLFELDDIYIDKVLKLIEFVLFCFIIVIKEKYLKRPKSRYSFRVSLLDNYVFVTCQQRYFTIKVVSILLQIIMQFPECKNNSFVNLICVLV